MFNGGEKMKSEKARKLILYYEGLNQPSKWPGGFSGITIGIGYDLSAVSKEQFENDWRYYLSAEQMDRLSDVIGIKGNAAALIASSFKDIVIRREDAESVFVDNMLPNYEEQTRSAFPGFDNLPEDAQGALVSLVYNRGAAMNDNSSEDRRKEMREIRDLVETWDGDLSKLKAIANQIREMKRLWKNKGLDGLLKRRDAEAALIESCME
jgi:GH24 family phage-related lysozyme (muramidase)